MKTEAIRARPLGGAPGALETSERLTQENDGQRQESTAKPEALQTTSSGAVINGRTLFFFVLLVVNSTVAQLFTKLSQRGGAYEYNTMSAMAVCEMIKLLITAGHLTLTNKGSVRACVNSFKGIPRRVRFTYLFLALLYAAYNQLHFYVLKLVDPGTLVLFKSLSPGTIAFLQFVVFRTTLTQFQVLCIVIQIFGIIPVTASGSGDLDKVEFIYGAQSMLIMLAVVFYSSFNSVYNAHVVKKQSQYHPVAVQNGMLYSFGIIINLLLYLVRRSPGDPHFFHGYNNANVIVMLFFESTVGVTMSMVYKYGDAVLQSISKPLVSAVLLFLSKVLFDAPLDIIKISGAGTVIVSTVLYLKLPSLPAKTTPIVTAAESKPLLPTVIELA